MTFPNYPDKHKKSSLLRADDFWKYKQRLGHIPEIEPPKSLIMCYSPTLFNYIKKEHNAIHIPHVFGNYFYLLEDQGGQIGVCGGFGIGAPVTSILLEELTAFGIRNYLSIGVAGCLQKKIELGTLIVCDKAIRDEGVSHHYLEKSMYAYPSSILNEHIIKTLKNYKLEYEIGASWTIDAPYRETISEVKKYRELGILTVEMEAAAIFAVASYLNVKAGSIFTISDYVLEECWDLHFHLTHEHMQNLFKIAKEILISL